MVLQDLLIAKQSSILTPALMQCRYLTPLPVILLAGKQKRMSNITQVVNNEKEMTTFKKGVLAAGLDQTLSSTGPFTVFAPTDLAFGKLEAGMVENLLKPENKIKLTALLNHHVVAGKINFKDLKDGDKLKSMNGKELVVKVANAKVSVDGATIQNHDVSTSNGVIHSLDTVLKN
ncbi:MAG: fasciclin domain-containing protein [Flavisolibacter sp.]